MSETKLLRSIIEDTAKYYPDGLDEGEVFEFYVCDVLLRHRDLSYDEIRQGVVDGQDDGGADAIFAFVNGRIISEDSDWTAVGDDPQIDIRFIQAKSKKGIPESSIDKMCTLVTMVFDLSMSENDLSSTFNEDVVAKAMLIRSACAELRTAFPRINIYIDFCHLDDVKQNVKHAGRLKVLKRSAEKFAISGEVVATVLGPKALYDASRSRRQMSRTLEVKPGTISDANSFVALVPLKSYNEFISENGKPLERLFEFNVRDYQGDRAQVNKEMSESVSSPKKGLDFWWLNNGISIICDKAYLSNNILTIQNPLIVNGLQTSHVLLRYLGNGKSENRSVMVRVLIVDDAGHRDEIIKATNSQTGVKKASLRATDPKQVKIEQYLNAYDIFYDRRKSYYKNQKKPANRIIGIEKMAQAVMTVLLARPDAARARPTNLIAGDEDYDKMFGIDLELDIYVTAAQMHFLIDKNMAALRKRYDRVYINNLRYYTMLVVTWNAAGTKNINPAILSRLKKSSIVDQEVEKAFLFCKECFDQVGPTDSTAKDAKLLNKIKKKWKASKNK